MSTTLQRSPTLDELIAAEPQLAELFVNARTHRRACSMRMRPVSPVVWRRYSTRIRQLVSFHRDHRPGSPVGSDGAADVLLGALLRALGLGAGR